MSLTALSGPASSPGAASSLSRIASQYTPAKLLALRPTPQPAAPQPAAPQPAAAAAGPAAVLSNQATATRPSLTPLRVGAANTPAPIVLDSGTLSYIADKLASGSTRFDERPELRVTATQDSRTSGQDWTRGADYTVTSAATGRSVQVASDTTYARYEATTRRVTIEDSARGVAYTYAVETRTYEDAGQGTSSVSLVSVESLTEAPPPAQAAGSQNAAPGSALTAADMTRQGAGLAAITARSSLGSPGLSLGNQAPRALLDLFA